MSDQATDYLLGAIKASWVVNYGAAGCTALLIADYFQTLPDEVKYVWSARWSCVQVLFFFVRYYPFAHTSLSLWNHSLPYFNGQELCFNLFVLEHASFLLVAWLCEAVIYLRLYAFSGRRIPLLAFLVPSYIGIRVAQVVYFYKYMKTAGFSTLPRGMARGCLVVKGDSTLISYICIAGLVSIGSVTLIMLAIAWDRRAIHHHGAGGRFNGIFQLFLRDGVVYFLSLSLISAINIIFDRVALQDGSRYVVSQILVHVNAILTGRMVIELRAFAQKDVALSGTFAAPRHQGARSTETEVATELRFAPFESKVMISPVTPNFNLQVQVSTETTFTASSRGKRY